jgi:peptidase E
LSMYDIVLVEWGNPFYLLKIVRETAFQSTMEELMKQWVVYIGKRRWLLHRLPVIASVYAV